MKRILVIFLYFISLNIHAQTWVPIGSPKFTGGIASYSTIAIDNSGTPYVAYEDGSNGNKATVMKYDGSNWVTVGSAGFSVGQVWYISIAIDSSGMPYVVYE